MPPSKLKHYSGTATTTPAKITLTKLGQHLTIANRDGTNLLQISFDSGNSFYSIPVNTTFSEDVLFHYFYIKSSASTIAWTAVVSEG